ncbi:MAG: hypothetical protein K9H64_00670 [Bacteroidales bacterium]|nr:hypothetical protein [Bacteroidales bacterium]MCF8457582.1 hypothetical protein [Bacteroidales bacterium]
MNNPVLVKDSLRVTRFLNNESKIIISFDVDLQNQYVLESVPVPNQNTWNGVNGDAIATYRIVYVNGGGITPIEAEINLNKPWYEFGIGHRSGVKIGISDESEDEGSMLTVDADLDKLDENDPNGNA